MALPIKILHHPLPGTQTKTSVTFGCAYLKQVIVVPLLSIILHVPFFLLECITMKLTFSKQQLGNLNLKTNTYNPGK
jgi:hypothetical protein